MSKRNLFWRLFLVTVTIATGTLSVYAKAAATATDTLQQKSWFSGAKNCQSDKNPAIEIHQFNLDTYILRQNKCIHYEAPFLYLLFGEKRALLIDTGATEDQKKFPLAEKVHEIMLQRAKQLKIESITLPLVIAHSHSHGDHIAADSQFIGQKNIEIIKVNDTNALLTSFAFNNWPTDIAQIDLGQRIINIIPTPGHQAQAITFYDPQTSLLLTGDSIYPGRLYIRQWQDYKESIKRLVKFSETHEVSAILGAHIEMSALPNVDYAVGSTYHLNEHSLMLTIDDLNKLNRQLITLGDTAIRANLGNMIVYPINNE